MDDEDTLVPWAASELEPGQVRSLLPGDEGRRPIRVTPPAAACRKVLFSTKDQWLSTLAPEGPPRDVALITRYGPVDAERRALLRPIAAAFAAPIVFAGDLDPLDLAAFATLALGPDPIPMRYVGIDDAWLNLCEVDLATRDRVLERVCIRLNDDERTGLDRLAKLPIDWPALVGPRCWALLQAGLKLELEGASNPAMYSNPFRTELAARLFT